MGHGDVVYRKLRDSIVSGELASGTHLNEVRISQDLGVSRTPLREALQQLAREDFVRIEPGRGAFVTEITLRDVVHLFQMREALEPQAVRLCAQAADRSVFGQLEADFESYRAVLGDCAATGTDLNAYYELIGRMDDAVDVCVDNPYLRRSLAWLFAHVQRLRQLARTTPGRLASTVDEHQAVCRAIRDGDPRAAAEAMSAHLANSRRNALGVLSGDPPH